MVKFRSDTIFSFNKIHFEYVICKLATILCRPRCVIRDKPRDNSYLGLPYLCIYGIKASTNQPNTYISLHKAIDASMHPSQCIYILRCHILASYMPSTKDESTMCTLGRIHLFQCLQTPKISQLIILHVHGTGFVIQRNHYDVTGEFPSQRPVTRSFDVFFDLCMNINDWVNHCEAGDLKRHRAHCDVTVMLNPYVDVLYLRDQSVYNSNPSTFRISNIHSCR